MVQFFTVTHTILSLLFSPRRVRVSGSVGDCHVENITIDTATDVSVVSLGWLKSHPSLREIPHKSVPRTAVALSAANGSPINVFGFLDFSLTLGGMTRHVTALVVPSLGPDSIIFDNQIMSEFEAVLDWENQTLSLTSGVSIPPTHRKNTAVPSRNTACPPDPADDSVSVAAVHIDAEAIAVTLCESASLNPMHEILAVAFADCLRRKIVP